MGEAPTWKIKVEHIMACNCNYGCPCSFDAPPTYHTCEAATACRIVDGRYGKTELKGLKWVAAIAWPGPIHEGKGRAVVFLDQRAKGHKREALEVLALGRAGGPWGILMSTVTEDIDVRDASIDFAFKGKHSRFRVEQAIDVELEPIRNPVTGAEHQAVVSLPTGLLARKEEMFSAKTMKVAADSLQFDYPGRNALTYTTVWAGP